MNNFLEDILNYKKKVIKKHKVFYDSIRNRLQNLEYSRYCLFKNRVSQPGRINLIAEIKKASPSKGMIRENFDLMAITKIYAHHGAAAISVLTEDKYFLGRPGYIKQVSEQVNVPVLTKDFILDEGQIYEARFNGASAVLLIVAILNNEQLKAFYQTALRLDLDCLVEVHSEQELGRALDAGVEIIGVNNRDLKSFVVDIHNCERLIPKIPKDKIIVAESGIRSHDEVCKLKDLGVNAVLIGETFMKEEDIGSKIDQVMYGM